MVWNCQIPQSKSYKAELTQLNACLHMGNDTGVKKVSEISNRMMSFTEIERKIMCVEGGGRELTE